MILFNFILSCFVAFQIAKIVNTIISYFVAKRYASRDLSFLSDREIKILLPKPFYWNYQMFRKMVQLFIKVENITDDFIKNIDIKKTFSEKDADIIFSLVYLLNKCVLDNALKLQHINKSVLRTIYYNRKYSHNDRVLKVCDPRKIYNILSILDAIKSDIEQNTVKPITDEYMAANLVYKYNV